VTPRPLGRLFAGSVPERPAALIPIWRETRAPSELLLLRGHPVWRGAGVPRGDGGPVLLVCGFLAGDASLRAMASWLKRIGYRPLRAGLRWNVGCAGVTADRLERLVEQFAGDHGRRVALIGQSRGGTISRALAARRPDLIDRVVTLGSPLRDQLDVHPVVRAQVYAIGTLGTLGVPGLLSGSCSNGPCCARVNQELQAPMPDTVTLTSLYSRSDGIVSWRACLDPDARCVEVRSSHIGMAGNVTVYREIAAALAAEPRHGHSADHVIAA
jgi:triacylglycerol lipase